MKRTVIRETVLLVILLLVGLAAIPIAVFWIGSQLLGEFGGTGFAEFFGVLTTKLLEGEPGAWILVLSPYLGIQCLRLASLAWRTGRQPTQPGRAPQP
jgi:hypothetical protein